MESLQRCAPGRQAQQTSPDRSWPTSDHAGSLAGGAGARPLDLVPGPVRVGHHGAVTLLFYVDESHDALFHYHGGVLVTGEAARAMERDLDAIVDRAHSNDACDWRAELHGVKLFHMTGEWAKATPDQAVAIYTECLDLLSKHGAEVIARGTDLVKFAKTYGSKDPYDWQFSNVLERVNERLRARQEHGLVIADQQHEYREILQVDLANAKQYGTGGYRSSKLERIVDTAHFVDSKRSRLVQLADLVTFLLRRRASTGWKESDSRAEAAVSTLLTSIYDAVPEPTGQYHTIRS